MNWYEKGIGLSQDGFVTRDLGALLLSKRRLFRDVDLGITAQELADWTETSSGLSWARFISMLCDRYGRARGKALVGNKTPSFVRRISTMHLLWPEAKFVHIIRDGRDVLLSARVKWKDTPTFRDFSTWNLDKTTTAALWWEWNVRLGREAGRSMGPDYYYEMRYEQLVTDPESECTKLCDFLGVPFEAGILRHQENFQIRHNQGGGIINERVALPITPGLRDWRSEMTRADLELFEAASGKLLDELAYPRATSHLDLQSIEHALRIRSVFEGRPLPQAWDMAG